MANTEKTFKISQLDEIQNLDGEDLFLVSDYEGGKCYTKKLTLSKLQSVLEQAIVNNPQLIDLIMNDESEIDNKISQKVDNKVEEAFKIVQIEGGNATGIE